MELKQIYKTLEDRLNTIANKDPLKIQKAVEAFNDKLKKNSKLQKVFNTIYQFYNMQFKILEAYTKVNDLPPEFRRHFIDSNYKMAISIRNKVINLKVLKYLIKTFTDTNVDFSPNIYQTVAKFLAMQDTLLYISMDKQNRDRFLNGFKNGISVLRKEVKRVLQLIRETKAKVKQKIKSYQRQVHREEYVIEMNIFSPFKKAFAAIGKEIIQDLYTTYKMISTPMLKFKALIDKHVLGRLDALISKLSGGNPLVEAGLKIMLGPFLMKKVLGPYLGGFTMLYGILKGFSKISNLENMSIRMAQQVYSALDGFENMLSDLE